MALCGTKGSETSLLQLASGYTAFLNQGVRMPATPLAKAGEGSKLLSAGAAFVMTDLVQSVVSSPSGTASDLAAFARSTGSPFVGEDRDRAAERLLGDRGGAKRSSCAPRRPLDRGRGAPCPGH